MKKVMKKRAGFTLVELLIVIIIIGILAGAMLLVAGSGTDKAEATKIVSDLRGLKAAALMYYADNATNPTFPAIGDLKKYMDRDIETTKYKTEATSGDTTIWWVKRIGLTPSSGINDKLAQGAKDTGLFGSTTSGDVFEATDENVYMRAR